MTKRVTKEQVEEFLNNSSFKAGFGFTDYKRMIARLWDEVVDLRDEDKEEAQPSFVTGEASLKRVNEPYDQKNHVNEDEVESWVTFFSMVKTKADIPLQTAGDFIQRMWYELRDLRSTLDKQIY